MVIWDSKYETGVKDIDEQHESLFSYINDLEECIQDNYYEGPRIEIILNFFQMFCATHFSLEETCMLRMMCPVHEENKEAHSKFLAYYKKFREKYRPAANKPELLKEFHGVLIKWLVNHILKIDMKMKTQAKSLVTQ